MRNIEPEFKVIKNYFDSVAQDEYIISMESGVLSKKIKIQDKKLETAKTRIR